MGLLKPSHTFEFPEGVRIFMVLVTAAEQYMAEGCGYCELQLEKAREFGVERVIAKGEPGSYDIIGVEF